jgi:hypothetical protein
MGDQSIAEGLTSLSNRLIGSALEAGALLRSDLIRVIRDIRG